MTGNHNVTPTTQNRAADIEMEPFTPHRHEQCRRFQIVSASGLSYEIFVSIPRQAPPPEGFPVLYLLDANADFTLTDQVLERLSRRPEATGVAPAILVGIGYPETEGYNQPRRHLDLTAGPTHDPFYAKTTLNFGGQSAFIAFLQDTLKPLIRSRCPADSKRETILGHSLGGYFVATLATAKPDLFSGYIAISPSIWWDRDGLLASLAVPSPSRSQTIRLYLAAGSQEGETVAVEQNAGTQASAHDALRQRRRMIGNVRDLAERCKAVCREAVDLRLDIIADEDHSSIFVACLPKALRFTLPFSSAD
ncbi:alpha/beta hydrolase-fold protein [uncultured Martelella sp.]|uniref:alpha/beta hydrolase n=1 Tax=uncultured Martelella sp. TaxID=392331 RepID=UPI0029C80A32|nr:alpha/beta hydrolase-fold protein [uncultured Martelella sp.]